MDTEARRIVNDIYPTLCTEATPQIMAVLDVLGLPYNPDNNADNLKQLHMFVVLDRSFWRLAFRDIARDTDERTLIFSLLPKGCGVGNTLNTSIPKQYVLNHEGQVGIESISPVRLLFAISVLNSIVVGRHQYATIFQHDGGDLF